MPTSLLDELRYRRQKLRDAIPTLPGIPYIFLSPFFIFFGVFLAFPVLYSFYLSFFQFNGVGGATLLWIDLGRYSFELTTIADLTFVGLSNYQRLLVDTAFHQAFLNTLFVFVIQVPLMVTLALALALAIEAGFTRYKRFFRTTIALPVAAQTVAYTVVFLVILQEGGVLDLLFAAVGIEPLAWLSNATWAKTAIALMSTWRWTGYNMILLTAGLQTIPQQLYEAAEIDGAGHWQKFRHVTIPQLKPVLLFVAVTATIGAFKKFAEPKILIDGGAPQAGTQMLVPYIYNVGFIDFELGYASAITYVVIMFIILISFIELKLGESEDA